MTTRSLAIAINQRRASPTAIIISNPKHIILPHIPRSTPHRLYTPRKQRRLLDFLNTPAPSTSRVPLATKLEIKDTDRCHIISVSEQLKAIPGLKQNTDLVDDLCDMFATCTFLGFTPAKMEESVGEVPEPVKKVEELKARIFEALEGEDEKVAELILGACHATHP
ncbi:hypothetical protein BCR33DRAFT_337255 [Rhizoclosmatium globosum]|uniref:Uncharacterized protein n=1 Tax=Rhizoclosmatium globosum TaxID=329046 RepID=A0A1Y2C3N7_9FUNG|nr:hypothetical protein BCR33DRAFT_337255 [Rhizoclosmatium globosum]|eukprot:ORY41652.1 hypothetical protein BCR33DRAFT_337255 [Rhizoclosmatium globosum]